MILAFNVFEAKVTKKRLQNAFFHSSAPYEFRMSGILIRCSACEILEGHLVAEGEVANDFSAITSKTRAFQ